MWRQRPDLPTHYTFPSVLVSQPTSETAGVPAAGCHRSLAGIEFFLGLLQFHHAAPVCGSLT